MTRHQRRRLARKRKDAKAEILNRRALTLLQQEKAKANLSQPFRGKRSEKGLVSSIYSGAANPLGYTRPIRWTKGPA
jgi:hypothetical protein